MAAFSDVGDTCAFPSCGRQIFLPFVCDACKLSFCEDHIRHAAHECKSAAGAKQVAVCPGCQAAFPMSVDGKNPLEGHICPVVSQAPARRCAAKGCREQLQSHNTVHCWRCNQDVCIKHRFEADHPCVPIEVAVGLALAQAQEDMGPEGYAEAHSTLIKVFGNILKDPNNEKFRTLKKENAVVKQKLRHPACIQALVQCGFQDLGDVYTIRSAADLSLMRQMHVALQKKPPGDAGNSTTGGGTRLVNGVIVRQPPPPAAAPAAAATASAKASMDRGYPTPGSAPVAKSAAAPAPAKPKSAFDFESRSKKDNAEKARLDALQEARKLQKERYKAEMADPSLQAKAKAPAPPPAKASQPSSSQSQQQNPADCILQ